MRHKKGNGDDDISTSESDIEKYDKKGNISLV